MKLLLIKNQISKKFKILFFLAFFAVHSYGQNDPLHATLFSFTPRAKNVDKVTGLAIGLGLNIDKDNTIKEINGLNIEVNPLSFLIVLFHDPSKSQMEFSTASINGISIGSGEYCLNENITHSGVQVALFNSGYACNGISANVLYNYVSKLNGIHVSALSNYSEKGNGLFVAFANKSEVMNGFQVGLINASGHFNGLQLGVFNKCKTQKGLQIGFWNSNNKRSFPFINW